MELQTMSQDKRRNLLWELLETIYSVADNGLDSSSPVPLQQIEVTNTLLVNAGKGWEQLCINEENDSNEIYMATQLAKAFGFKTKLIEKD